MLTARAVFAFCFALESCKTKRIRLERFCTCLVIQKALLATESPTINKIPNIPQCTLPPHPVYQTLLFYFEGLVPRLSGHHQHTVIFIIDTKCATPTSIRLDQHGLTVTAVVCMTVQSPSLLVLNCGVGRFLLMKANVAASLVSPHSIRMRLLVRTVKRACPTSTTEPGFGFGSYRRAAEFNTAKSTITPTDSLSMVGDGRQQSFHGVH